MFYTDHLSFKPLRPQDFSLLTTWLNETHVHEWYDKNEKNTLAEVTKRYSFKEINEPTDGFIAWYNNNPVGYIQWYKTRDWPEFRDATGYNEGVAGIDLFIGNPEYIGKGFGRLMIRQFLKEIVFADKTIQLCIIDPEPTNKRAIRAYEKAGFRYKRTIQIPQEEDLSYLMELQKDDFFKESE